MNEIPFKAIIVAAGKGNRMSPVSDYYPKTLLPILGQPLVIHQLSILRSLGVRDITVIMGYKRKQLATYLKEKKQSIGPIEFAVQKEFRGIADAVLCGAGSYRGPIIVVMGDTFFEPSDFQCAIRHFEEPTIGACLSIRKVDNVELIKKECTVLMGGNHRVKRIVEKPRKIFSMFKPCGFYFFSHKILDAIINTPPSSLQGEVELTDSIQTLIDSGAPVYAEPTMRWDANLTFPADLWDANLMALRLRGLENHIDPSVQVPNGTIITNSSIGKGVRFARPVTLNKTVVFSHTMVKSDLTNQIISPSFSLNFKGENLS